MRIHNILPESRTKMERLYTFVSGGVEESGLSEEEKELLTRCSFADDMLRQRHTDAAVAKLIRQRYGVSHQTALNDIATAKYVFSSIPLAEKEYGLKLLLELNMKALNKCFENNEYRIVRDLMETRLKIFDRLKDFDQSREEMANQKSGGNTYIMRISMNQSGGRPRDLNLMSDIQDLNEDEIEMVNQRITQSMIPDSLVAKIREKDE